MYRRMPLRFLPVSALLAASIAAAPGTALAETGDVEPAPSGDARVAAALDNVAAGVVPAAENDTTAIDGTSRQVTGGDDRAVPADQAMTADGAPSGAGQPQPGGADQKAVAAESAEDGTADTQPQTVSGRMAPADEDVAAEAPVSQDVPDQAPAGGKKDGAPSIAAEAETGRASDTRIPADAGNGIPTVTVFVDESDQALADARALDPDHEYGTLADVLASARHTVRGIGGVGFVVPESYKGEFGTAKVPEGIVELKYLRGRGNSTWGAESKRPFKIELEDKVDLFGMGAAKGWALLANDMDPTLLKNRIGVWLARQIGLPYTPQMVPVDVVMVRTRDGLEVSREYCGSYCLSELVEVGDGRVAIDKLKDSVTDVAGGANGNITGGHLLSLYWVAQNYDDPKSTVFNVGSGTTFINKTPEFESEDLTEGQRRQRAYIRDYVRVIDQLIMDSESIDAAAHDAIADRMDLLEAANYLWLQVMCGNPDAFGTSSTYLYKPRDGKLCWGPIWDLDLAWNSWSGDFDKGLRTASMPWFDALREKDPQFVQLLRERWSDPSTGLDAKLVELTRPGGILDTYRDALAASWEDNKDLMVQSGDDEMRDTSLREQVELLREWIESRRAWIAEHLDDLARVSFKVDFVADGKPVESRMCKSNERVLDFPEPPEREGYVFTGWVQRGAEDADSDSTPVIEDTVFEARYLPESDVVFPDRLFFASDEAWANINGGYREAWTDVNGVFQYFHVARLAYVHEGDFLGKVKWSSSDESIASYDRKDLFHLVGTGDVTITATLHNGVSARQLLHVFDGSVTSPVRPTGVGVPAEMTVEVGKTDRIDFTVNPAGKPLECVGLECEADDGDIVQVDCDGVVRGLKPGETNVLLKFSGYNPDDPVSFEAVCKVRVVEAQEDASPLGGACREVAGDEGARREAVGDDGVRREAAGNDGARREADGDLSQVRGAARQADMSHDAVGGDDAEKPSPRQAQGLRQAVVRDESGASPRLAGQPPMSDVVGEAVVPVSHAEGALPKTGDVAKPEGMLAMLGAGLAFVMTGLVTRKKRS